MDHSTRIRRQVVLTVGSACLFALALLVVSPILVKKTKFLLALPFAGAALTFLALNFRWTTLFIIGSRSCLDPILSKTKGGGGPGIGGLLNLFVILMVFITALRFPEKTKKCRPLIMWLVYIAVGFSTILFSPMRGASLRLGLAYCTYAAMFLAPFLVVNSEKDRRYWIRFLLLSSFLPIGIACLGIVTKHQVLYDLERLNGTFSHANILAFYTVLVITVVFYVLRTGLLELKQVHKLGLCLYLVVLMGALLMTKTRSAWIACAMLFFLYGILKERKVLIYLFVAMLLLMMTPQVQERMKDLKQGTGTYSSQKLNSMAWRVKLWQSSIPSILQKPVLGHGLGTFQDASRKFFPLANWAGSPAHNVYVETLFEAGLVGLMAYLSIYGWILWVLFRRMRRSRGNASKEAAIGLACVLGYLIVGYSDNMLHYLAFNWYFWFFTGLVMVKEEA